jgi:hypothetical protein
MKPLLFTLFLAAGSYAATPPPTAPAPVAVALLEAQLIVQQAQIVALQRQVTLLASNPALKLGPFVTVDPNPELGVIGPNITFTGANIHIVNGMQATGIVNGLGNLIIGYDEAPVLNIIFPGDTFDPTPNYGRYPGERSGSHNLIIGPQNRFTATAYGSIVGGSNNTSEAGGASVLGGSDSVAGGAGCIVLSGAANWAGGGGNVICSGLFNTTGGNAGAVLGGENNSTVGNWVTVLGGYYISPPFSTSVFKDRGVYSPEITIRTSQEQ